MSETVEATPVTYRTGQALLAEFEATGAEKAFEEIVRLYAGMVYSVCQQVTKNAHDAEDSTQATFLALATQVKLGKQVKCLGPWLRQVAKRTSLDLCKSRKRREKREENHGRFSGNDRFNGNAGEANLESQDYKTALHDELNKLPTRYRLPLVMHYFGGLPPEQTALELNCKPKTLAVRLHRGRKMLAAQLNRRGIFMGGEALGIASAPYMFNMLGHSVGQSMLHSTAHAAVGLTSGLDISTVISTRVMGLIQTSAKAALFAKVKFLAMIVVLCSTMLAGAAHAGFKMAPSHFRFPNIQTHVLDFIKPLIRALTPSGKLVADAASQNTDAFAQNSGQNSAQNNVTFALNAPRTTAFGNSNISLASYDSIAGRGDYETLSLSPSINTTTSAVLASVGSIQLRRSSLSLSRGVTTVTSGGSGWSDDNASLADADALSHRANVPTTPTPEPFGIAAIAMGGSLFLRRRPTAKSNAKSCPQ